MGQFWKNWSLVKKAGRLINIQLGFRFEFDSSIYHQRIRKQIGINEESEITNTGRKKSFVFLLLPLYFIKKILVLFILFIKLIIMRFSSAIFRNIGLGFLSKDDDPPYGRVHQADTSENLKVFKATYGVSWNICEAVWDLLDEHGAYRNVRQPEHLMWCLLFLKAYTVEYLNAKMVGTTPKTFRKWVWRVMEEIASLRAVVVSFNLFVCG